ncbi:hypothetical protein SRB17_23690 [Streptomyces sp. RB17]|uniref:EamA family transporter n=1 Tax=Streptomyces sp. RB17 TaxID=2585197 RepID=UPI001309D0FC|nr:EamA family transporter [Streptomyces sp. RB17]MQY34400.1 hypothetical protein [Streptomyces sp. RB17]
MRRRRTRSPVTIAPYLTPRARAAVALGRGLGAVPAPGLVLGGILGLQGGAALTTGLYPVVGPAGVVTLRLAIAALVLTAMWRPRIRGDRTTLGVAAAAGTLLAVHHLAYYEAVARLPLGAATTLEFLGPFAIALSGSRRAPDLLWAGLAATGVLLLSRTGTALDSAGAACAAVAGCCWAGYILVGKRLAQRAPDGRGLALAVTWGALLSLPYGIAQAGTRLLDPGTLAVAAVVAVLSSVVPYTCQLEALRRLTPRVFGVLTSLEPAIGALTGLLFLGQHLAPAQWAGVAAVGLASVGATRREGAAGAHDDGDPAEAVRERGGPGNSDQDGVSTSRWCAPRRSRMRARYSMARAVGVALLGLQRAQIEGGRDMSGLPGPGPPVRRVGPIARLSQHGSPHHRRIPHPPLDPPCPAVTGMSASGRSPRSYRYVGPEDVKAAVRRGESGTVIRTAAEFADWAVTRTREELSEPFTFVIGLDGALRLAPRRSEHVACAGGEPVLGAGEIGFREDAGRWAVREVSNQSTGYCPDTDSWPAVAAALDRAGLGLPGTFTDEVIFRRCPT